MYLDSKNHRSDVFIEGCNFIDNSAGKFGGAIYIAVSDTYVRNFKNTFKDNKAQCGDNIASYPNKLLIFDDKSLVQNLFNTSRNSDLNFLFNKSIKSFILKPGFKFSFGCMLTDDFDNILIIF